MKKTIFGIVFLGLMNSAHAQKINPDPYEKYNRAMFAFNDKADHYVFQPVARGYRKVTPSPVRTAVGNVFNNLRDVVSFGSNVLRGNLKSASEDFVRVSFNTTFGLGGLINFADAAGMPNNKNTLGDTFASWGWKNSNYFVYPFTGPSTVRDSIGSTVVNLYAPEDALLTNTAARTSATALKAISLREQMLDLTDGLNTAALDKYSYTRDIYMAMRAQQLGLNPIDDTEIMNDEDWANVLEEHTIETENVQQASDSSEKNEEETKEAEMPIEKAESTPDQE